MNKVYSVISGAISFWIPATVMVYVYIRWIRHSRKVSQDWVRFWPKSCSVLKIFNIIYGGRLLVVLVSFVSSSTNFVQNFLKFEWCVSASFANSYAFTKIFQVLTLFYAACFTTSFTWPASICCPAICIPHVSRTPKRRVVYGKSAVKSSAGRGGGGRGHGIHGRCCTLNGNRVCYTFLQF